jgi:hypothetical protein
VLGEELHDPGAYRDAAGFPVHPLVPEPGGLQYPDLLHPDPLPGVARHVEVVRRVLPLEDGSNCRRALQRLRGPQRRGLLEVAAPQRRGGVNGLRQRCPVALSGAAVEASVRQRHGAT